MLHMPLAQFVRDFHSSSTESTLPDWLRKSLEKQLQKMDLPPSAPLKIKEDEFSQRRHETEEKHLTHFSSTC